MIASAGEVAHQLQTQIGSAPCEGLQRKLPLFAHRPSCKRPNSPRISFSCASMLVVS
ncbi:MAG: hypothetical protein ACK56F_21810 [bacterium]